MTLTVKVHLEPGMSQALAHHAPAHAGIIQNVYRALLQHPRTNAGLAVVARAGLNDDALNAVEMQQM